MYQSERTTRSQTRKQQGIEPIQLKARHSRNTRDQRRQQAQLATMKKLYQAKLLNPNFTIDSSFIPKIHVPYSGNQLWNGQRTSAYPTRFSKETKEHFSAELDPILPCNECGKPDTPKAIDHITPLFEHIDNHADKDAEEIVDDVTWYGYSKERIYELYNDIDNLQVICKSCNSRKGGIENAGFYGPSTSETEHIPYAEKPIPGY